VNTQSILVAMPLLLALAVLGVIDWLMPDLTRRDIFFGVTVPPGTRETPQARAIVTRYRSGVAVATALSLLGLAALVLFVDLADWVRIVPFGGVPTLLLVFLLPYLLAHRSSCPLAVTPAQGGALSQDPATAPSAELRPRRYNDYIPWLWEVLPVAVIAATVIYLAMAYASAPSVIPIHFNAAGNADRFAAKTVGSYFGPVWVQISEELVLSALAWLLVGSKARPGAADHRFRLVWLRALFGLKLAVLVMTGTLAAGTARAAPIRWAFPLTFGFVVLVLVGTVAISLWTGQGGSRLGDPRENTTDRLDDRYWKLGILYVNGRDPSLFVERRFGIGWGLNFGNPAGILLLAGIIALVLLPVLIRLLSIHG
jgi:uncharacterized membrane protein